MNLDRSSSRCTHASEALQTQASCVEPGHPQSTSMIYRSFDTICTFSEKKCFLHMKSCASNPAGIRWGHFWNWIWHPSTAPKMSRRPNFCSNLIAVSSISGSLGNRIHSFLIRTRAVTTRMVALRALLWEMPPASSATLRWKEAPLNSAATTQWQPNPLGRGESPGY